jgi:hypothetical protein
MSARSQRYLDNAAEFERLASNAADPESKKQFADIAKEWPALANDAAHLERMRESEPPDESAASQ